MTAERIKLCDCAMKTTRPKENWTARQTVDVQSEQAERSSQQRVVTRQFYIVCEGCGDELTQPGALLFSPPSKLPHGIVWKVHLCCKCYDKIRDLFAV